MPVHHVPSGYHVITPILLVHDADALIDFIKRVFEAKEYQLGRKPDGRIWHADLTIAGAHIMISTSGRCATRQAALARRPAQRADPGPFEALGAAVNVYVPDVDDTYRRALEAGASSVMAPSNRLYGDRNAVVKDRTGILWSLATHVEDVPHDELTRREADALKQLT